MFDSDVITSTLADETVKFSLLFNKVPWHASVINYHTLQRFGFESLVTRGSQQLYVSNTTAGCVTLSPPGNLD